jgi:hypothetical protein
LRVTVHLHAPVDPAAHMQGARKALAAACRAVVADGAARLRQNRDTGVGLHIVERRDAGNRHALSGGDASSQL